MVWGGVGWGGVGCLRSLHFVHFMLLRCRDLWDRCYVTCCYVADGVGWCGVGWGGMFTFLALRYISCCYAVEISGIVATSHVVTLLMVWGGVGWGGVGCLRSLHFVHFMLLRCRDLWDRCYVTCCYVADGVGWCGVGWGGMFTFLALRTFHVATL